jgi:hypothetical protein
MKKITTIIAQTAIVLIGIGALVFLLVEPHLEGRNAEVTPFQIYFNDPFLAYAYAASVAFFVMLYRAFKLTGYAGQDASHSMDALRGIRRCAMFLIAALVGAEGWLVIVERGKDDIAGGVAMGLFLILIFAVVAITAAMLERKVRRKLPPL